MSQVPGVVDNNSSANAEKSILSVRLKREQASDLGIGVSEVAGMLSPLVGGEVVSTWTDTAGETYDIVARLQSDQRASAAVISELMMTTPKLDADGHPQMVRLDQVADVAVVQTASEIRRLGQSREILVSAHIANRAVGEVMVELDAVIAEQKLPASYQITFGGDAEEIGEMTGNLIKALIMQCFLSMSFWRRSLRVLPNRSRSWPHFPYP
jgi:HAE1 family hydrophobic/amphiphilic exporter-1